MLLLIAVSTGCRQTSKTIYLHQNLNNGWQIQSSEVVNLSGKELSTENYRPKGWYTCDAPATVMAILKQNKKLGNIFKGKNLEKVDVTPFQKPWWYRKEFTINDYSDKIYYNLILEGINYKADIWINGKQIGDSSHIEGPYGIWKTDVSKAIHPGKNVIAIEVVPPKKGDLTIGFVDWNPSPPDKNMGLWRGVKLIHTGKISVSSPFVASSVNTETLKSADLTVSVMAKNHSAQTCGVTIQVFLDGIGNLEQKVQLAAGEERQVTFTPSDYPVLKVQNPRLWWPNNLGKPELYNMEVSALIGHTISDKVSSHFGIREIEQYVNKEGYKGFKINGKKLIVKGAGWVDNLFLDESDQKVKDQVAYVRHMNLNCIRLEGFWGKNSTLYDEADKNGILIMVGWSCQWEWEAYCGRPETNFMSLHGAEEIERYAQSYREQVLQLRNHPSVFLWVYASDKLPVPDLERKLNKYLDKADGSRPILAGCKYQEVGIKKYNISKVSGPTGVKMLGPYGYVPPVFWYIDTISGGAYGFNTETGPGPQIPPIESIKKMIPEKDLWPINNDVWDYHCGKNEFGSLKRFMKAFNARYGKSENLKDFAFKAQISNYEAIRPMFEAFQINRYQATGVIQWMLNSAWPEFFWQLYDYYLRPNGAFYGTMKACQPLNAIYNYKDRGIYLVNDYYRDQKNLKVKIRVFDIRSNELLSKEISEKALANSARKIFTIPLLKGLSTTYFVDLRITSNQGKELANNFYWLSTKADQMDFSKTTWVYTPQKSFADFKELNNMPKTTLRNEVTTHTDGDMQIFRCNLNNKGNKIAFFTELAVVDQNTHKTIAPVLWSDNYISLLPGENRTIIARIRKKVLENKTPGVTVHGWNVKN